MAKRDTRPLAVRIAELETDRAQVERTILDNFPTAYIQFMREKESMLVTIDTNLTYLRNKSHG